MKKFDQKIIREIYDTLLNYGICNANITIESDINLDELYGKCEYYMDSKETIPDEEVRMKIGSFDFFIKNRK